MTRLLLFLVVAFSGLNTFSQTLFTYGKDSVSVNEFLQAYKKNNQSGKSVQAMKDYLDLYITARLKIKEAQERGYDTLPNIVSEMESLRAQISPSYLNDEESQNKLLDEAFTRSQKDIHLAHIFIPFSSTDPHDTSLAKVKAAEAYKQLQSGVAFADVAKKYSADPSATTNGGDLGFITVFSLPYELENLAYTTPVGKISSLYQSKHGYHIFKNLGERKALGRMKAAQILLALPDNAGEATKQQVKKLADSLYNRLLKGDDFGKLAAAFSSSPIAAHTEGRIPEFGIGQFDAAFEKEAFALLKDGDITKPFITTHGYHIIQRISRIPVSSNRNNSEAMQQLREKILQDQRMAPLQTALAKTVLQKAGYKLAYQKNELESYTNDILSGKTQGSLNNRLNDTASLFKLGNQSFTVATWINYARANFYKTNGGKNNFEQLWDKFLQNTALYYYSENLEAFNPEFKNQLTEFKEGNLFFEIMQREVWGPAQTDTLALKSYYEIHKEKYIWNKSADAIVFYASDPATAEHLLAQLKKEPYNWHKLLVPYNEKVTADSARMELSSIPGVGNHTPNHTFTQPIINKNDSTASFAYVNQIYDKPVQRSFTEAKGSVMNDYGNELEKKWVAELKKKYPVKLNSERLTKLESATVK